MTVKDQYGYFVMGTSKKGWLFRASKNKKYGNSSISVPISYATELFAVFAFTHLERAQKNYAAPTVLAKTARVAIRDQSRPLRRL